jgi:hypothetical protein
MDRYVDLLLNIARDSGAYVAAVPHAPLGLVLLFLAAVHLLWPTRPQQRQRAAQVAPNVWRSLDSQRFLVSTLDGADTLAAAFSRSVERFAERPCLGTRAVLSTELVDGISKQTRGDYQWISYSEAGAAVDAIGRGLVALGLKPGSRVGLFANTCRDWQLFVQALFRFNFVAVTAYTSLGEDALVHALGETNVVCVFADDNLVATVLRLHEAGRLPSVTAVVHPGLSPLPAAPATSAAPATPAAKAAKAAATPKKATTLARADLEALKLPELKAMLKDRGLPVQKGNHANKQTSKQEGWWWKKRQKKKCGCE